MERCIRVNTFFWIFNETTPFYAHKRVDNISFLKSKSFFLIAKKYFRLFQIHQFNKKKLHDYEKDISIDH